MNRPAPWLVVAGDFTPFGGMDAANYELARRLAADSPTTLVAHRVHPDLAGAPGMEVRPVWRPWGKHLLGGPLLARAGRTAARRLTRESPGARGVVNGGNCDWPDINWVHYVHAAYDAPPPPGLAARLKAGVARRLALGSERRALRAARVVVCNSRLTARHVVELVGVRPERARVVYYGHDAARFGPVAPGEASEARRELGLGAGPAAAFVGALGDGRKGFATLYAAWKLAAKSPGFGATLVVVGRGASLGQCREAARADGLEHSVRFLGFREDVPRVLAACQLMVHPARYEAYGLGVQEALGRGVPAFVSRESGVAERYPAELGDCLLDDPADEAALARRLVAWCADPAGLVRRFAPLAEAVRSRTWDDMHRDFLRAVES